ncbi:hypothetical protein [Alkaliphilus hydrothermalis]|uniref:Uncharacterized protein n=1 Tax=Alkaliphilus hydrothermalis TaxID=1482730 RepID=A0ABS2NKY5_9FIRM|nr:hypothetical protein [Alkaliphilus hydrothermalis]MBM7613606.1 hypothetical protein [Alkaliphilus hydrothermalis]
MFIRSVIFAISVAVLIMVWQVEKEFTPLLAICIFNTVINGYVIVRGSKQ